MLEINSHHSRGSANNKILTQFGPIHNTEISSGLIVTFQSFSLGLGLGPDLILQHIYGALGIARETGQWWPNATISSQQLLSLTPMTGKQVLSKSFLLLQLPPSNWKYQNSALSYFHLKSMELLMSVALCFCLVITSFSDTELHIHS